MAVIKQSPERVRQIYLALVVFASATRAQWLSGTLLTMQDAHVQMRQDPCMTLPIPDNLATIIVHGGGTQGPRPHPFSRR